MSEWRKDVGGHDIAHAHHHKSSGAPAWMENSLSLIFEEKKYIFLMDSSYPPPAPIVDSDPERWFGPCHCWSQYVDAAKKLAALLGALTAVQRLLTWPSGICTNFPGFPGSKKMLPKKGSRRWVVEVGHVSDKWLLLLNFQAVLLWLPSTSQWSHHWPSLP